MDHTITINMDDIIINVYIPIDIIHIPSLARPHSSLLASMGPSIESTYLLMSYVYINSIDCNILNCPSKPAPHVYVL